MDANFFHTPNFDRLIVRCRRYIFSVAGPGNIGYTLSVAFQCIEYFSRYAIPEFDDFIRACSPLSFKTRSKYMACAYIPAEASIVPSGLNAIDAMEALCPLKMMRSW